MPRLLDEVVASILASERDKSGAVAISGPPGAGKSSALEYLRERLDLPERLLVLDDPEPEVVEREGHERLVLYAARSPCRSTLPTNELRLVPWDQDDCIEFLMEAGSEVCASVLRRIARDKDWRRLEGCPELLSTVLAEFAVDETLTGVSDALLRRLEQVTGDSEWLAELQEACLNCELGTDEDTNEFWRRLANLPGDDAHLAAARLARHRFVQELEAAECVAADLSAKRSGEYMLRPFPADLIRDVGRRVVDDRDVRRYLEGVLEACPPCSGPPTKVTPVRANVTNLLHAADRRWLRGYLEDRASRDLLPPELADCRLDGVVLTGAKADDIELTNANLRGADLMDASLRGADMDGADLRKARLSGADLTEVSACNALLDGADMQGVLADGSSWKQAALAGANLAGASLRKTRFDAADLSRADLTGADLTGAHLLLANLEQAVLTRALLEGAALQGADLTEVDLRGADLRRANLRAVNLEGAVLAKPCFAGSDLSAALLTGSRFTDADLNKANLFNAGLAEVHWEGADLRGANLAQASFHLGSTRSGRVSGYPSEGTRTGFYTEELNDAAFRPPSEIRKANLRGADLRGAVVRHTDWYLVDLRDAKYDGDQLAHFRRCGAIL